MMPGMPADGDSRLSVAVTLSNPDNALRQFDVDGEFLLGGGRETIVRPVESDTFNDTGRLGPGSSVDGTLYFDVKSPGPADPPFFLEWRRDGGTAHITIPVAGTAPTAHAHP